MMETSEDTEIEQARQQRIEKTISALFDISKVVSNSPQLEAFYQVIHKALTGIFCTDNFFIALYDPFLESLNFPYYAGENDLLPLEGDHFNESVSLVEEVMSSGRPMIFSRAEILALAQQKRKKVMGPLSGIWMGVPLIVGKRVAGVMAVQEYDTPSASRSSDLDLLTAVSRHVALALERESAQTRIRDQGEILEKILESSPVGIALIENRVFKWVNGEMVRMFGYPSKQDLQNQSVKKIYRAASDFEFAGKTIFEELSSQGTADYEMDLIKQDGTPFPVHVRLNSTDRKTPMSWTIASFTDVSKRRTAEKENFERERLRGVLEMAGAVCHEINQPLQAIIGYSELLLMNSESPESRTGLESIRSQAGRLGEITSTLANITRYKTVDYPGNTRIVDIWGAGPPKM